MSSSQDSSKRTRKYGTKSRTGCLNCRRRHVKCDEGRPSCHKCVSTGRKCQRPLTWNNDSAWVEWAPGQRTADTRHEAVALASRVPGALKTRCVIDDPEAIRQYFTPQHERRGGGALFDRRYWPRIFSVMAVRYPEIQHLMAAKAIVTRADPADRTIIRPAVSPANMRLSMHSYHAGLRALRASISDRPIDAETRMLILICTTIFVSLELLYGDYLSSLAHFEGAAKGLQLADPKVQATVDPELLRAFKRLDLQASGYAWQRTPLLAPEAASSYPSSSSSPSSLTDALTSAPSEDIARAQLDDIGLRIYAFVRSTADQFRYSDVPPERAREAFNARCKALSLETELQVWCGRFSELVHQPTNFPARAIRLLYNTYCILLGTCVDQDEMAFDGYNKAFADILRDADEICVRDRRFTLDSTTLQPLYTTATRCRDRTTRLRALGLLETIDMQEGVWDTRYLRLVARTVMEIEERLASAHPHWVDGVIPDFARIHTVSIAEGRKDGKTQLLLSCRYKPQGAAGPWADIETVVIENGIKS